MEQLPTPTQLITAARTLEQMCNSGMVGDLTLKLDLLGTAIMLQQTARQMAASNALASGCATTREEALANFDRAFQTQELDRPLGLAGDSQ